MKVNSNYQSQSFGSIKLTNNAKKAIESLNPNSVEDMKKFKQLRNSCKTLMNTKYYHLEIGDDLKPEITSTLGDKFTKIFDIKKPKAISPNSLSFETIYSNPNEKAGKTIIKVAMDNAKEVASLFKKSKKLSEIEKAAKLTKIMDDACLDEVSKKQIHLDAKSEIEAFFDGLYSKFGNYNNIES